MTNTEDLSRAVTGAEVLNTIARHGDKMAAEIFRGKLHALAHGLHAVSSGREAAEELYRLADHHAVMGNR